jgi:hypothetical protein
MSTKHVQARHLITSIPPNHSTAPHTTYRHGEDGTVVVVAALDHLDGTLAELDGRSEEGHRADGRPGDHGRSVLVFGSGLAGTEEEQHGEDDEGGDGDEEVVEEEGREASSLSAVDQTFEEGHGGWGK